MTKKVSQMNPIIGTTEKTVFWGRVSQMNPCRVSQMNPIIGL
jgi:hypothetical protein